LNPQLWAAGAFARKPLPAREIGGEGSPLPPAIGLPGSAIAV